MTTNFEDLATLRLLESVRARLDAAAKPAAEAQERSARDDERQLDERPQAIAPMLIAGLDELRAMGSGLTAFPSSSRLPGGRLLHRIVGRSVRRDTAVLVDRLDRLASVTIAAIAQLADHVDRSVTAIAAVRAGDRAQSELRLDRVSWRQEALEDAVVETAQRSDERWDTLTRRMRELDDVMSSSVVGEIAALRTTITELGQQASRTAEWIDDRDFRPTFSVEAFVDAFRGSRDEILLRYADVADVLLTGGGPVLDLGCGRGELVELVVAKGGSARGVEVDPSMVAFCRSKYLDVRQQDAIAALESEADASLGGVALIQVVEHLTAQQLVNVLDLARRKLRRGGVLVSETVNGTSPFVLTRSFFVDPTHTNPVHHEYLTFLLEQADFSKVEVEWRSPVPENDRIPPIQPAPEGSDAELVERINERILRLNQFLFSPQDYLVIARV